jgi:hypothetical protein
MKIKIITARQHGMTFMARAILDRAYLNGFKIKFVKIGEINDNEIC